MGLFECELFENTFFVANEVVPLKFEEDVSVLATTKQSLKIGKFLFIIIFISYLVKCTDCAV